MSTFLWILIWIALGAVVGLLASLFFRRWRSVLSPLVLGAAGAVVGGLLSMLFGLSGWLWMCLLALAGAILVLLIIPIGRTK